MIPTASKIEPFAPRGIVIAGGPSLTPEQIKQVADAGEQFFVIGVNNAFQICPYLDMLYAADFQWIDKFLPEIPESLPVWSTYPHGTKDVGWKIHDRVNYIPGKQNPGVSVQSDLIHYGSHSGYQAINIAILKGCKEILLLGVDMKGAGHWFGDYGIPTMDRQGDWASWLIHMDQAAEQIKGLGVNIINCSPDSAINSFPKLTLMDALHGTDALTETR